MLASTVSVRTCAAAPQSDKTTYTYNATNELATRTDGNGHAWSWSHDDDGRLQSVTSPLNKVWQYGSPQVRTDFDQSLNPRGPCRTPSDRRRVTH